jgi:hypothetical protein
MQFSARPLIEVSSVNDYIVSQQITMATGDETPCYFQLVDLDKNPGYSGSNPQGLRYIPLTGATLAVSFININTAKRFTRYASQPFAQDPSIWLVTLLATDTITGTVSIRGVLTEDFGTSTPALKTKTFNLPACILASV